MLLLMCALPAVCPWGARRRAPRRVRARARSKLHGGATLEWEVHPELGVCDLKALVEAEAGISVQDQRILHKGRAMNDEDTLEAAGARTRPPRRAGPCSCPDARRGWAQAWRMARGST